MAFNLGSVKKIVIPEGSVKKITTAANGTIWANPSLYPYRKLDYIKFSGAESINFNKVLSNGCYAIDMMFTGNGTGEVLGNYDSMYIGTKAAEFTSSAFYFYVGCGNTYAQSPNYVRSDYFPTNGRRKYVFATGTYLSGINIYNGNSRIGTDELGNSGNAANRGSSSMYLGYHVNYLRVYGFQETDYTWSTGSIINIGTVNHNWVPVQRKSDNKCGLYDTIDKVFKPMTGTSITTGAAGPVADEYPDGIE